MFFFLKNKINFFAKKISFSIKIRFKLFVHKYFNLKNFFFTFHLRPKYINAKKYYSISNSKDFELAIILQGPILHDNDFTCETIKFYIKLFPNAHIVLSTWKNENIQKIKKIDYSKLYILSNDKPDNPGIMNVNFQIISTLSALKFLKKKKIKYVIKSRSDIRIYGRDLFVYLKNILSMNKNNNLLVVPSYGTSKYGIYKISDFFLFGEFKNVYDFWNVPLFQDGIRKITVSKSINKNVYIVRNTFIGPEMYLYANFLIKHRLKLKWSLEDWWHTLTKYFYIVDSEVIDIYWHKYFKLYEHKYTKFYDFDKDRAFLNLDWLNYRENPKIKLQWKKIRKQEIWKKINSKIGFDRVT